MSGVHVEAHQPVQDKRVVLFVAAAGAHLPQNPRWVRIFWREARRSVRGSEFISVSEWVDEYDNGVMSSPELTEDEYERTIESLRGTRLVRVAYYPLSCGDDGTEIEDWDFGAWHLPTMGVGLLAESGTHYSAVWGSSFDHYGLELFREPMSSQLTMIGEPGGSPEVVVTDHPSWSGFIGVPLVGAKILWSEGDYGHRLPVAIELRAPTATAWLVAGRSAQWPPTGHFWLGTDDVMAVFTREFADAVNLPLENRGG
ncbi:hypothetical protein [Streptomyces sp. NPDC050738]|uniref:hypothetical protein n=1 Tax=Streptomyces sp. NPDC050738 TaxID=3154744 RepID=UPI00341F6669